VKLQISFIGAMNLWMRATKAVAQGEL